MRASFLTPIPALACALILASTAAAEAKQSFNTFFNANRYVRTPEGTLDEIYNRTFKQNTVERWMGRRKPLQVAAAAAAVAPWIKGLRPLGRAISRGLRPFRAHRLARRLISEDSALNEQSKLRDAFYLSCLVSPPLAKLALGVEGARLTASAARAAQDFHEAGCLSRAAVYAAAHRAGVEGVDRAQLASSRAELGQLLQRHDDTRRRTASTIRTHLKRCRRADAALDARSGLCKVPELARKLVHDEVIAANLGVLRREHRAIRGIKRVLERLEP
jgi:hypothetical protein